MTWKEEKKQALEDARARRVLEAKTIKKMYMTGTSGMVILCMVFSISIVLLVMLHNFGYDLLIPAAFGLILGGVLTMFYIMILNKIVKLIIVSRTVKLQSD